MLDQQPEEPLIKMELVFLLYYLCWKTNMDPIIHYFDNIGIDITNPVTTTKNHILPPSICWKGSNKYFFNVSVADKFMVNTYKNEDYNTLTFLPKNQKVVHCDQHDSMEELYWLEEDPQINLLLVLLWQDYLFLIEILNF